MVGWVLQLRDGQSRGVRDFQSAGAGSVLGVSILFSRKKHPLNLSVTALSLSSVSICRRGDIWLLMYFEKTTI